MGKLFSKYVLQSVVGTIGISIYILADTYFISLCSGADGLATLNLTLPIYGIIFAIGAMIGIGSATRYALLKARGDSTKTCFSQSLIWTTLCSLVFVIVGIFWPDKLLALMGADENLVALGTPYLRIAMMAAPIFMNNFTFTAFVRNDERPTIAMIGSVGGSFFNIAFDYILMFPLGMGFIGAAIATALSPVVSMAICMTHFCSKKNHVEFVFRRPTLSHFRAACGLGVPAFVGEITAAVTTLTFNTLILSVSGNVGVAAYGIVANNALVVIEIFNGIAQGVQPLLSTQYGSGNKAAVRKLLKMGIATAFCTMAAILLFVNTGTDLVVNLFNHERNMQLYELSHTGIRLYFLGFIPASVNVVMVTYFAAIGKTVPSMIGSLSRGLVGIVLCAIVLCLLFGLTGIWLSFLAAETLTFAIIVVLLGKNRL